MRLMGIEIRQSKDGQWYYVCIANNGEVMNTSELYPSKSNAKRAANDLIGQIPDDKSKIKIVVKE